MKRYLKYMNKKQHSWLDILLCMAMVAFMVAFRDINDACRIISSMFSTWFASLILYVVFNGRK